VKEAASALGVSERHLRRHLNEIPHVHLGNRALIPVEALRHWLEERTVQESNRAEAIAAEILRSFD
jgi:excisionase family DNA binding protein